MPKTTYEVGQTVQVAPAELLLQRNIRDAAPDAELVRSVKAVGVLEPITAVVTAEDRLLVRFGHRRTLAAVEAEQESVPVYVSGTDTEDQDAEVHRIITQRDENTHRAGLSTADEVGVVEQLAAFGLSANQIAKRSRLKRATVDHALAVSESALARKATNRYTDLTLDQAATVAEFEDDPEAVKALIIAAHEGRFDHTAQRLRDQREEQARRDAVATWLTEDGTTVVDPPAWGQENQPVRLSSLTNDLDEPTPLDVNEHRDCPGHVAWIGTSWGPIDRDGNPIPDDTDDEDPIWADATHGQYPSPVHGCADPTAHGHHDRYAPNRQSPRASDMSEEEREAARQQRRLVVENNKAWDSAETVRREWVAALAKAKTPPKGTERFLAEALSHDPDLLADGHHLAAEWLGKQQPTSGFGRTDLSPAKNASTGRCLMITLIQVLAAYENRCSRATWRQDGTHTPEGRYLRFLTAAGYTLSEVEQYALSDQTA